MNKQALFSSPIFFARSVPRAAGCLGLLALAATIILATAEPQENQEDDAPIVALHQTEITADKGSIDFRSGVTVFEGNVRVIDRDVSITSDQLQVQLDQENQITTLTAIGNVVIRQPAQNRVAYCEHALYTVATRTMVLTENPRLQVGSSILEDADKIIYNMDSETIATEGSRTRITIPSAQ